MHSVKFIPNQKRKIKNETIKKIPTKSSNYNEHQRQATLLFLLALLLIGQPCKLISRRNFRRTLQ